MPWRAYISALLESISERLLICKDDKETAFDHTREVFDGFIHCQELSVVRTVLLLSVVELMGLESQMLPNVARHADARQGQPQNQKRL